MILQTGQVYRTQSGTYLRLESKGDLLYNFVRVTIDNKVIPDQRNKKGVIVLRSKVSYSEESILSFKIVKYTCQK